MSNIRFGALLVALAAIVTGVLVVSDWAQDRERCFQYDVLVADTICGTPDEIDTEQRRRGREMAQSAVGVLEDPVGMCVLRSGAQAEMHDWPDRYREAYADGCRSLR